MTNDVRDIIKALELIHVCCENIEALGGCSQCPMGNDCFDYNSLLDSYERIPAGKWEAFLGFADDVYERMQELDMSEEEKYRRELMNRLDMESKGERDERAVGW